MTVQHGKKEFFVSGGGYYERKVYDVIVKTDGNYVETLINLALSENGMNETGVEVPIDRVSDLIEYKIYPNMTMESALLAHGIASYTWSEPLMEV